MSKDFYDQEGISVYFVILMLQKNISDTTVNGSITKPNIDKMKYSRKLNIDNKKNI